ncbi:MAG: DUF4340 domain-containing protein [Candidatus Marinimicrobia bacterium]|jgi:hypothetical protein|nr:DUF4340 domain-containing protein [Candidatus Neomarinimicrobiota bacterium]
MKKGQSTLILLGVLVILFTAVYFFEIKGGEKREQNRKLASQLFQTEKDSVNRLILSTANSHIVCEKKGAEWIITAPVFTQGDAQNIESNLSSILSANIERKIVDSTADLNYFGLLEPRGQVQVISQDGKHITLMVGDENPTGTLVFVKYPEDQAVYTTNKSLWNYVDKRLYDLRDKKIMHFNVDDVRKISLVSRSQGTVSLEKSAGKWRITAPVTLPANDGEVKSLLNRLSSGRAKDFIAEEPTDLKKYGLAKPAIKINLEIGESLAHTSFSVGDTASSAGGGFYAKEETRPPIFTIEKWTMDGLEKGAFDLQDKKVVGFDDENADRIVWKIANQEFTATKIDSVNWMVVAPETLQVDQSLMRSWLEDYRDLSVDELESYQPKSLMKYGLDSPRLRVTIFAQDKEICSVLIGKEVAEKYYFKTAGHPHVYRIKKSTFERINKHPKDLTVKTVTA